MDHVQQILLKQLNAGQQQQQNEQVDWAAKAKQWAEKQKRDEETRLRNEQRKKELEAQGLQGWKNEHPSWERRPSNGGSIPPPPPPPTQNFASQNAHLNQSYQPNQQNFQNSGFNNESFNARFAQYQQQKRQQHHQRPNRMQQRRKSFPEKKFEKVEAKNRNLPKWMLDEIERLQNKEASGEDLEEGDEKHLSGKFHFQLSFCM